jgi:hypothetical protein
MTWLMIYVLKISYVSLRLAGERYANSTTISKGTSLEAVIKSMRREVFMAMNIKSF